MIEVVSVVRVVCDLLGSVSIWSPRSSEHFLRRLGQSGRSFGNQALPTHYCRRFTIETTRSTTTPTSLLFQQLSIRTSYKNYMWFLTMLSLSHGTNFKSFFFPNIKGLPFDCVALPPTSRRQPGVYKESELTEVGKTVIISRKWMKLSWQMACDDEERPAGWEWENG